MTFDEKVEFYCRELCKELGQEPTTEFNNVVLTHWRQHEPMVRDWLMMEAFSKVKNKFWNKELTA